MSKTQDFGIRQKNPAVINFVTVWYKSSWSVLSMLTHLMRSAEHVDEDSGSSSLMMIGNTWMVLDESCTEGWSRPLLFLTNLS